MFDLIEYLAREKDRIDQALGEMIKEFPRGRLSEAMAYSLSAGGKRIRPILVFASARAVGGQADNLLPVASAIELIHTFSLIHDDLPAMDDDDMRRGKPTCHKAFDEATAILAGDGLLSHAFYVLTHPQLCQAYDKGLLLRVVHLIAEATGAHGMTGGQMEDILGEVRDLSFEDLKDLHEKKTGALILASVLAGAVLGGGDEKSVEALSAYGRFIGLAFQVQDDILNVVGDPGLMGKAQGTDAARDKSTFPGIMGLEKARQYAEELVEEALRAVSDFGTDCAALRGLARHIVSRRS